MYYLQPVQNPNIIILYFCFTESMSDDNPWEVQSIEDFLFLKCPECIFDTKEENIFQGHALEKHPLSFVFFGKQNLFTF